MIRSHVEVLPVVTPKESRAFTALPYQLYRRDPHWVAPLMREERKRWSEKHNASLRSRWVRRYLVQRDGEVVGRIAAIIDVAFSARWSRRTGLFGFFECVNDQEAACALLDTAETALRAHGLRRVIGPVNLTTHDETGILIGGFDSPPTVMSPYNPPYYAQLLEHAGYRRYQDYHAYLATPHDAIDPALQRLVRSAQSGKGITRGVTLRQLDLKNWESEVATIYALYNASFADVWGFVPIGWQEFQERADRFRPFVRPEFVLVAELDGKPVGFALTLPDINEALHPLGGKLWPFGWLRLIRRVPRVRTLRFILLGVRPDATGRGIGALLAFQTQEAARQFDVDRMELSLVQATNKRVQRVIRAFGCPTLKTYRLYTKPVVASVERAA